jgi:hypothetical protein
MNIFDRLRKKFDLVKGDKMTLDLIDSYIRESVGIDKKCIEEILITINVYVLHECIEALTSHSKLEYLTNIQDVISLTLSTWKLEKLSQSLLRVYLTKTGNTNYLENMFREIGVDVPKDSEEMKTYQQIAHEIVMDRGSLIVNTAMQTVQITDAPVVKQRQTLQSLKANADKPRIVVGKPKKTVKFTQT